MVVGHSETPPLHPQKYLNRTYLTRVSRMFFKELLALLITSMPHARAFASAHSIIWGTHVTYMRMCVKLHPMQLMMQLSPRDAILALRRHFSLETQFTRCTECTETNCWNFVPTAFYPTLDLGNASVCSQKLLPAHEYPWKLGTGSTLTSHSNCQVSMDVFIQSVRINALYDLRYSLYMWK